VRLCVEDAVQVPSSSSSIVGRAKAGNGVPAVRRR
jgi:hypothetical protein